METIKKTKETISSPKERVVLFFFPFWTPNIPPQGITTMKNYLQKYGYYVKTYDPQMSMHFKEIYDKYFDLLRVYIPDDKKSNFINIGHDVMYNHMMAHVHYIDYMTENEYINLIKVFVDKTFYHDVNDEQVKKLNELLVEYYKRLEKYVLDIIEEEKPDIVGATAYSHTLSSLLFSFKKIKERYPHIITTTGGGSFTDQLVPNTPNFDYFLKRTPYIDKIFCGQSYELFLRWLRGELPDKKYYTLKEDNNGKTVDISTDIDVPDLSDLNTSDYLNIAACATKSCPNACSFCNTRNFYGEHKKKNPKQVVREMEMQYEKYRNQLFFMLDALLNTIIFELTEEMINSKYALYYIAYLRAWEEAGDINNTLYWRKGGLHRVRIGIESGSQHVLDMMGKNITPGIIRNSLKGYAYAGIQTTGYFVIGHPGETEENFQETLDLIEECKDYFWEVEPNPFNYYYSGQNGNNNWASKRMLLYPENSKEVLISESYTLDIYPKRELVYDRMNRFIKHCQKLNIPNCYSIPDIFQADLRWKKLHKNAVPSLFELRDIENYTNECKTFRDLNVVEYVE